MKRINLTRQHRTSRDHHDWDERTPWDRSEQATSRAGAIDGGGVGKRRNSSQMGRQSRRADRRVSGANAGRAVSSAWVTCTHADLALLVSLL